MDLRQLEQVRLVTDYVQSTGYYLLTALHLTPGDQP